MANVIKATDRNRGVHAVAFNFDDLNKRADVYLAEVRAEAGKIIAKANADAIEIRKKAEVDGRKSAEQTLDKQLDQKVGQQMQTLLPAVREAIAGIHQAKQGWLSQWEQRAVHLSSAIAERIIRKELSKDPQISLKLVREALNLASGSANVRVLLNPQDHAALVGQVKTLVAECSRLAPTEIIADPKITPGGCRVETRYGSIDQQIEAQLKRIEAELT
jgi:flagellar assembly protein FliH